MGILEEPVIGWRHYGVSIPGFITSNEHVLMPCQRSESFCKGQYSWNRETKERVRLPRCVNGPEVGCTCGFYTFDSSEHFFRDGGYVTEGIIAQVYLWGRVLVHSKGYRAQYAYPKQMWAYGALAESLRHRLAIEYKVPVGLFMETFEGELRAMKEAMRERDKRFDPPTEDELWDRIQMGDDAATKVMRARLSSAICTRRKAIKRLEADIERNRMELVIKSAQREGLKRTK